jgi:hypothetical protein
MQVFTEICIAYQGDALPKNRFAIWNSILITIKILLTKRKKRGKIENENHYQFGGYHEKLRI